MCHLRSGYSDYGPLSPPEHRSAHRRTRAISVHDYSANRKILFGFLPQTMEKGSLLRINEQTESGAETAYFENVLRTTLAGSFRTNPGAESGTTGTGCFFSGLRPGIPPPVCGLPARLCPFRKQNSILDFTHHTGYGTSYRRLHHHGLWKNTDSTAHKRIAGQRTPIYMHGSRRI